MWKEYSELTSCRAMQSRAAIEGKGIKEGLSFVGSKSSRLISGLVEWISPGSAKNIPNAFLSLSSVKPQHVRILRPSGFLAR